MSSGEKEGDGYDSLNWRIPSIHLLTVASLQEYELETMFIVVSGIEQRILHSSMPPKRLLRRKQDDMMA
jgi:hypothetical protein